MWPANRIRRQALPTIRCPLAKFEQLDLIDGERQPWENLRADCNTGGIDADRGAGRAPLRGSVQPVEARDVVVYDLLLHAIGEAGQVLGRRLAGLRPDAIGLRIGSPPQQVLLPA